EPHPRRLPGASHAENYLVARLADVGAERAEHRDVRVDLTRTERAALDLVLEPRLAETHEQARDHHDRGAHRLGQPGLRLRRNRRVVDIEPLGLPVPGYRRAELAE